MYKFNFISTDNYELEYTNKNGETVKKPIPPLALLLLLLLIFIPPIFQYGGAYIHTRYYYPYYLVKTRRTFLLTSD